MPGIIPLCASWRRQSRQMPNFLYTARGRPHRRQRECARVGYLGVRCEATIFDVLAIREVLSCLCRYRLAGVQALVFLGATVSSERESERVEQRERLAVGLGRRGDRDVEPAHLV